MHDSHKNYSPLHVRLWNIVFAERKIFPNTISVGLYNRNAAIILQEN
jgi:hypothetical protein